MKKFLAIILATLFLAACGGEDTAQYRADLLSVSDEILDNAAEVEGILDQYSSVWDYSIESRGAIPVEEMAVLTGLEGDVVREYFIINNAGNISDDFSMNVNSMISYYNGNGDIERIEAASTNIKDKIVNLNDPPEGYDKAYDEILEMYDLSERFKEMAINPSGSLQTFNQEKNQLASDILSKHKMAEVTMPSED